MSVRESLQKKWTPQAFYEWRAIASDWLKFDELSNGDQHVEVLIMRRELGFHRGISSFYTQYQLIMNELSTLFTQLGLSILEGSPRQPYEPNCCSEKDSPPHQGVRHLLLTNSLWVLQRPTEFIYSRVVRQGQRVYRPYPRSTFLSP